MRWPDREAYSGGYSEFWPSWEAFWSREFDADSEVPAPAAIDEFLERMGPDESAISLRVR